MYNLNKETDLTPLLSDIDDANIVMLGEASHGTHEYYTWRTAISKRLIKEKGFKFIAVEGDWPDCYKINRYVKGYPDAGDDIASVLVNFDRWPTWMWANWEVAGLAEWLREYNKLLPDEEKVGFYGLDVYSLWDSMREMVTYLEQEDPETAKLVKEAIRCFEPYYENEHKYAQASLSRHSCKDKVLELLKEVRQKVQINVEDREAQLNTIQNAEIMVNAEKYYTSMMGFDNESWNVRDTHMMETLNRLLEFHGKDAKAIVWEHNTHIGDARATDMKRAGMVNIGELARLEHGRNKVYLCGFGSYRGTVIAGDAWGAPMEEMEVPEARQGSFEYLLHTKYGRNGFLLFSDEAEYKRFSEEKWPHRAIGVVYNPEHERYGNYVPSVVSKRYDAFIYIEETKALHPLHINSNLTKMPELYPFGV
jgi:erythromycin esterase